VRKMILAIAAIVLLSGCATLTAMVDDYCAQPTDERLIEFICNEAQNQ